VTPVELCWLRISLLVLAVEVLLFPRRGRHFFAEHRKTCRCGKMGAMVTAMVTWATGLFVNLSSL
jgi:hypothetical protein